MHPRHDRGLSTASTSSLGLWGHVYDNISFPLGMRPVRRNPSHDLPALDALKLMAGPSASLQQQANCIAANCSKFGSNVLSHNACQCAAWKLACSLNSATSAQPMRDFCQNLDSNLSPCSDIERDLLHSASVVSSLQTLNSCFPAVCSDWGEEPRIPRPCAGVL